MIAKLGIAVFCLGVALLCTSAAYGQVPPAGGSPADAPTAGTAAPAGQQPTTQPAQQPAPGTAASGGVKYPPSPKGFFRGNGPGGAGNYGNYLGWLSFFTVLGLFLLWTSTSRWVDEDSRSLKVRSDFWNSITLACGLVGFLAVICLPKFLLGFIGLLMFTGVPLGLYIKERNDRVPDASKVMTRSHIQNVVIRTLAKYGIMLGGAEIVEAAVGPSITFIGKSSTGRGDDVARSRQVESSRGFLAAKELMYDAILRRSTDVHIEPKEEQVSVRIRIDGVMYPTEPFDKSVGEAVINIFKVLSAMDITEKRRPQDGSFRAEMENHDIDFRVATQGTRYGEKMSLRILDQGNSVSTLKGLGLRKQLLQKLQENIHQPHGLFLSCGPTGAGKSTTLYAALNEIDSNERNVITVEDPIEYKMENVNQIEINTKAGNTFAKSLRSILRQDPDVVMIGEIRDKETAEIACQAANTGHMVFSTIHANDTITALYRLLELGVEPFMVSNSVSAIMAQRLARRLCNDCKEAYRPNPQFLKKAGLPAEKIEQFFRPPKDGSNGCPACGGRGYKGRIGTFELLQITDRMRDMIREKSAISAIKAEARKNGMLYMKEEGLRLVVRGVTSIDEILRVVK